MQRDVRPNEVQKLITDTTVLIAKNKELIGQLSATDEERALRLERDGTLEDWPEHKRQRTRQK